MPLFSVHLIHSYTPFTVKISCWNASRLNSADVVIQLSCVVYFLFALYWINSPNSCWCPSICCFLFQIFLEKKAETCAADSALYTKLTSDGLLQVRRIYCRDHSSCQMWHISTTGDNARYTNCCWQKTLPKGKPTNILSQS